MINLQEQVRGVGEAMSWASPCLLTLPQYRGFVTGCLKVSLIPGTGEKLLFCPQKMPKSNAGHGRMMARGSRWLFMPGRKV